MKKIVCILAGILLAGGLAGCSTDQQEADAPFDWIYTGPHEGIIQDSRTGVQYIFRYQGGICVMVNPDGTPYIGEVAP